MERTYCVYKHTVPNGKIYIGITKQKPERRWCGGKGYRSNPHFNNAIKKYGWENIEHEILLSGLTCSEASEYERLFISLFRSNIKEYGYNHTSGGESGFMVCDDVRGVLSDKSKELWKNPEWANNQKNIRASEEFRDGQRKKAQEQWADPEIKKKMVSAIKRKYEDPEYKRRFDGILRSPERKKKISEASRERWADQEYKNRLSESLKRSCNNEERKKQFGQKMKELWRDEHFREAHTGSNNKSSKPVFQYDLSGHFIKRFDCVSEAGAEIGKNTGHICACANGQRKTAYGYIWKYA